MVSTTRKNPNSHTVGIVLLFVPSALGLLVVFDVLPGVAWVQITTSIVIIGCVGLGSYLAWWGERPRRARGDWTPSKTLPEDDVR